MKKKPKIEIIAAVGEKMEIGYNNQLLCHLPSDLKRFKSLTLGHTIVMGRKTWDSLSIKPLPYRRNIVFTANSTLFFDGAEMVSSIKELFSILHADEKVFIVGGAMIYKIFLPLADTLHLTRIHNTFHADTFFPDIDISQWVLQTETVQIHDEENPFDMTFQTYFSRELIETSY